MAARPLWSGSISFGLVSIPVRMFVATRSQELRFHFVDRRDLMPVGYDKVRKDTGEHDVELAHAIDILDFVRLEEIDPIYFRQAYYLLPQQGGEKPYRLLGQALDETGRVGVAKVVIRNKQQLACLRTFEGVLLIETMYYADEVRRPESLEDDLAWRDVEVRPAELEMAKSLVESLSAEFDPGKYDDTYREDAEVVDLMQALLESVERTKRSRAQRPKAKKAS
jgi:DNA end-binding protein Ku